jgi:hypothetical protein
MWRTMFWNNKFYYKAASCLYFYLVIYDARIHEYLSLTSALCGGGRLYNATFRPLYPLKWPGVTFTADWVGPRTGLDWCRKSGIDRKSIPRLSSPYRAAIPVYAIRVKAWERHWSLFWDLTQPVNALVGKLRSSLMLKWTVRTVNTVL